MRKWIVILIILFVAIEIMTACADERPRIKLAEVNGKSLQINDATLILNKAYFEDIRFRGWHFLIELTVKNTGEKEQEFNFWNCSNFYAQDDEGKIYEDSKVYINEKIFSDIHKFTLSSGQERKIWIHFGGVPKDVKGLKIFYEDMARITKFSIPIIGENLFQTFVKPHKNPKSAEEVLTTFYFLTREGKYHEAEKLVTVNSLKNYRLNQFKIKEFMTLVQGIDITNKDMLKTDGWNITIKFPESQLSFYGTFDCFDKKMLDKIKSGGPISAPLEAGSGNQRVELLSINESYKKDKEIFISFTMRYVDNTYSNNILRLTKQSGKWKIIYDKIFSVAPKNPKTLEEITAAFYFLFGEGEYDKAEKLLASGYELDDFKANREEFRARMSLIQSIEITKRILLFDYWEVEVYCAKDDRNENYCIDKDLMDKIKKGQPITVNSQTQRVKLLSVRKEHKANSEATVYTKINRYGREIDYYGRESEYKARLEFIKQDGEWKIIPSSAPPVETFTITASTGSNGSISPSGDVTVNEGSDKTFTISPNENYQIGDVLVDESSVGSVSSYTFNNVTEDHSIYATFIEETFNVIEFEDPNLEQTVRETINKPDGPLYLSDVIGITELDSEERGIKSLEGIQHLQNLEFLKFNDNQISDISALSNLTNLEWLEFNDNQISDISALSNLTNLEWLEFNDNQVSDISALSNLPNLEFLKFNDNQVSDISALSNLTNLQGIGLNDNQVSDISALSNLTNLDRIFFSSTQVSDISALSNLTNLEWLEFNDNQISDISALSNLTNLKFLDFNDNQISDISALSNLTNLQGIGFNDNQVSDISALSNLTNLQGIGLNDNQVSDISALSNLTNLKFLKFNGNQVSDISALSNLTNLKFLKFNGNQVSDISVLSNLNNLMGLYFYNNQVMDISALVNNGGLGTGDYIYMGNNYLNLTEGSQKMQDIETLISRGVIVDYKPQTNP